MDSAIQSADRGRFRVLVLKRDRLHGELLANSVKAAIPGVDCVVVGNLHDALTALQARPCDLLVAGIGLPDGDAFSLLAAPRAKRLFRRVLIVTAILPWTLLCLSLVEVNGVLDSAHTTPKEFEAAIRQIASGGGFVGPASARSNSFPRAPAIALHAILTRRERQVLALIADGCNDVEAADFLGVKYTSVHSIRVRLYAKLGVGCVGHLVRLAGMLGVVRYTPEMAIRTGFDLIFASRPKRVAPIKHGA